MAHKQATIIILIPVQFLSSDNIATQVLHLSGDI